MSKHRNILCSAVISVALAFPFAAPLAAEEQTTPGRDTVVATVNGTDITLGQMIITRAGIAQQADQFSDQAVFDGILDRLIQETLLAQSLEDNVPARVEIALSNERRTLVAAEAMRAFLDAEVSEDALMAFYETTFADEKGPVEWNASHILLETLEDADAVREEILAGADFAETAKEKSTGPSGPRGGALDWFGPGMMVPEFETAVSGMKIGDVSEPVQTQFGWHLIRLNDSRQAEAPTFEAVRGELLRELESNLIDKRIAELTDAGVVDRGVPGDIDASVLRNLDLLED